MTLAALPYLALAAAVAAGGAYVKGRNDGKALAISQATRDYQVAVIARDAAADATAAAIARIRVQHTTIRQEVEREVRENTVYRECRHDAASVQRINAAITGASASAPGNGSVPAADTAGR